MLEDKTPQGNSDWLKTYGLALKDEVPCDSKECSKPSVYYGRTKCCRAIMLGCDEHMRTAYAQVVALMRNKADVKCFACGETRPAVSWLESAKKLRDDTDA